MLIHECNVIANSFTKVQLSAPKISETKTFIKDPHHLLSIAKTDDKCFVFAK